MTATLKMTKTNTESRSICPTSFQRTTGLTMRPHTSEADMLEDLNPTTRCYARSLIQAFPTHYPEWFEPPPQKNKDWMFMVGVCLWVLIAYYLA